MRIQSINNTVNFGYNKQLNDTVNKKLEKAKGNKELAWGGSCKGDKHKNSFSVVVNQTLYELDKLLRK